MTKFVAVVFVLSVFVPLAMSQAWKLLSGKALDISAKGTELWATNHEQRIFRWSNKTNSWVQQSGQAARVAATPDGTAWAVKSNGAIYRYDINTKEWELIPGSLSQISAISKDRAIGVDRQKRVFLWEGDAWVQQPGSGVWACIGEEDERWLTNAQQEIFRWNHDTGSWITIPGNAANIDCQAPDRVIATDKHTRMFLWRGDDWRMLAGNGARSTIGAQDIYTVNNRGDIFVAKGFPTSSSPTTNQNAAAAKPQPQQQPAPQKQPAPAAPKDDGREKQIDDPTITNVDKEVDDKFRVIEEEE